MPLAEIVLHSNSMWMMAYIEQQQRWQGVVWRVSPNLHCGRSLTDERAGSFDMKPTTGLIYLMCCLLCCAPARRLSKDGSNAVCCTR